MPRSSGARESEVLAFRGDAPLDGVGTRNFGTSPTHPRVKVEHGQRGCDVILGAGVPFRDGLPTTGGRSDLGRREMPTF